MMTDKNSSSSVTIMMVEEEALSVSGTATLLTSSSDVTPPSPAPAAKVDWSKSAFFGQTSELKVLSAVFEEVIGSTSSSNQQQHEQIPAAFLWGVSGTGKSFLVEHFIKQQQQQHKKQTPFYFLKGKHDEYTGSSDPLSSIIQAMNDFVHQVGDDKRIRHLIETHLGEEMAALTGTFPSLTALMKRQQQRHKANATADDSFADAAWNRLQYTFAKFIKTVATKEMPVVIFLDDLQWAPQATLNILETLLTDPSIHHFFLLGTIRQDYKNVGTIISPTKALADFYDKLSQTNRDDAEHICLSELSEDDTNVWLSQVLERNDTTPLTAKIYDKTDGNIFFTIQTIHELQHKGALYFEANRWEWNLDGDNVDLCNDVVDSVAMQLRYLPKDVKHVLTTAAYIRSQFDIQTLFSVWQALDIGGDNQERNETNLQKSLERAVLEGLLLNQIGGTTYQFSHDRIQQAAYELVPSGSERSRFRSKVGRILLQLCKVMCDDDDQKVGVSSKADDGLVFVAVDHFNSAPSKDHLYSTKLNLEIGQRALRVAALEAASKYLEIAYDAFQKVRNGWDDHYDLALRLHQTRATSEISLGNYDVGHMLLNKILSAAKTVDDKLPTYLTLSASFGRQERSEESLSTGREAMQLMGEFPQRGYLFFIIRDLLPAKAYFKKHTDEEILRLPLKTDPHKKLAMKFFTQSSIRAYSTGQTLEFLLSIGRSLKTTIKEGLCPESAMGLATLGMVAAATGDQAAGVRFGALAIKILEKTKDKIHGGWVYFVSNGYINAFSQASEDVIASYQTGYEIAMKAGDFEIALITWTISNFVAYFAGRNLSSLAKSGRVGLETMERFKTLQIRRMGVEFMFMIETMMGDIPLDENKIRLGKEEMIVEEKMTIEKSDLYYYTLYYWARVQLCTYLMRYEWADNHAKRFWKVSSFENAYYFLMPRIFFGGLAAAGLYSETKNKKHLKKLRKMATELKKMVKARGLNSFHRSLLLDALLVAAQGAKPSKVKKQFETFILIATNAGCIQDAALGHELAGEHFLKANKHEHIGDYFTRAVQLYQQWGCHIKVEHILKRRLVYVDARVADSLLRDKKVKNGEGIGIILAGPARTSESLMYPPPSTYTVHDPVMNRQGSVDDAHTMMSRGGTLLSSGKTTSDDGDDNMSILTDGS